MPPPFFGLCSTLHELSKVSESLPACMVRVTDALQLVEHPQGEEERPPLRVSVAILLRSGGAVGGVLVGFVGGVLLGLVVTLLHVLEPNVPRC